MNSLDSWIGREEREREGVIIYKTQIYIQEIPAFGF